MQKIKLELKDKPLEPLMRRRSLMITPKKIILSLFIVFLVLVVLYFWKEIGYLIKPPALEVLQPPADITVNQEKFEISGKTTPFAFLTLNGEELYIDKEGYFLTSVGAKGYLDYPTYRKLFGKKVADQRRRLYKQRHQADRKVKGTPGFFADQLLW